MGNFNENTRVQVPAALHLCKLGYQYLDENDIIVYDHKTNILTDVFLRSVKRINPEVSSEEVSTLYSKVVNMADNADLGREFFQTIKSTTTPIGFPFRAHSIAALLYQRPFSMFSVRKINRL